VKTPRKKPLRLLRVRPEERARLQKEVLELIADGLTVTRAAEEVGITLPVVTGWQRDDPAFAERYKEARINQAHALADQLRDIADEPVTTMVEVKRNELRIETTKWIISKSAPTHYGEKVRHDHTLLHGVVILPALDYTEQPIAALEPGEVGLLPLPDP